MDSTGKVKHQIGKIQFSGVYSVKTHSNMRPLNYTIFLVLLYVVRVNLQVSSVLFLFSEAKKQALFDNTI